MGDDDFMTSQRGNALFLILIAVALFAALSYAITQSGRGSGNIQREQDTINAAQVIQAASVVRYAVQRMIVGGVASDSIKAETVQDSGVPCTTGDNCLFSPTGGGLPVSAFSQTVPGAPDATFWYGEVGTYPYYVANVGTAAADVVYWVGPVSLSYCKEINKKMGLGTANPLTSTNGWTLDAYPGAWDACFIYPDDGKYYYYSVLYPR